MILKNEIISRVQESMAVKERILSQPALLENIEKAVDAIVSAYQNKKKVLLAGNGGSAADAQHIAAEFSGRFYFDRPPLPAEALHVNTSFLTAVANDYSYDEVYARMLRASGEKGDVFIGISTSGNSGNIIKAMEVARQKGMFIVAFTGESGGKMKDFCDCLLNVPSTDTPRIQEAHITIGHIICEFVEKRLFEK
jgi:D-sedoheptulose 7-phosphate isomerase